MLSHIQVAYGQRERRRRKTRLDYADAQRKCLGLPPDAPGGLRFSPVHWHPAYACAHPKGMGRRATLLDPQEAARYGMITVWNKVTEEYDGTPKVLAIPNYLGVIRGKHAYDDVRARSRPAGKKTTRPTRWNMLEAARRKYVWRWLIIYAHTYTPHPVCVLVCADSVCLLRLAMVGVIRVCDVYECVGCLLYTSDAADE